MYNIDYAPKNTNTSTFIETPDLIKKCTINPQNKDNKCFQYSGTLSSVIQKEYQRLNHLLTILIGKTLIFHHNSKIINNLK